MRMNLAIYEGGQLIAKCAKLLDAATLLIKSDQNRTLKFYGLVVWNTKVKGNPQSLHDLSVALDGVKRKKWPASS